MFVDLMNDIAETFTDRFLKLQLVIEDPGSPDGAPPGGQFRPESAPSAPPRRYNALGVLEDVASSARPIGGPRVEDIGPAETPDEKLAALKSDPVATATGA